VARLLILGGGCRGRQLAAAVLAEGHAVRILTRSQAGRTAIEAVGAECFIGDPNRLGTLRGVLDGVAVACWLLATATGSPEQLRELHLSRLPAFLGTAIDSTLRAFIFEAPAEAAPRVRDVARRNAIPASALTADPRDVGLWLEDVRATLSLYL
jgi:uncharacterized protein YbjT (DUF2867 family)